MHLGKVYKLAIVFSGDFPEGNTKNARLKIIANELKQKIGCHISFLLIHIDLAKPLIISNQDLGTDLKLDFIVSPESIQAFLFSEYHRYYYLTL